MCFLKGMDEKIKKMNCYDISVLKICVAAFTIMLVKLWPAVASLDWKAYGVVFLISYVFIVYKFFIKK